jgi:hypothetical protein
MKQFESTLATIATQVYKCKTATEAKELVVGHLLTTQVKDRDKMITEVARMNNLNQIWKYLSNALLRFEGLSTNTYLEKK